MQTRTWHVLIALVWLVAAPAAAYGQASITGVVRDTSGAVLPGVTVEAASPALIEKVRTVVTDGAGQYRIIDLRPGTYTVTFTLPGFAAVKRDGLGLTGTFTATVNAELRVGTLQETITVTGETPVVDVQSAQQQQVMSKDVIAALPTGRSYQNLLTLNPAVIVTANLGGGSAQDVGGNRGPQSDRYTVHGSIITDSRVMVDGLGVASADAGGAGGTWYVPNISSSQEVVATTSGGMGEAETSGVIVNVISREGGNTTSGVIFATGATSGMQSDNFSQALQDSGLRAPSRIDKVWDINPAVGGPIARDKLWYFVNARHTGANNFIAGMFHNKNAGDPNSWTYEPDLTKQAIEHGIWRSGALRLTWQASPRHRFAVMWDEQYRCLNCPAGDDSRGGGSPTQSPEASTRTSGWPTRVQQATWASPRTNRLLLEAGFGTHILGYGSRFEGPAIFARLIPVTEQAGAIPGLTYRAISGVGHNSNSTFNWRSSVSYVTGTHNVKVGYRGSFFNNIRRSFQPNGGFAFRFNNGVPNQLTQRVENKALARVQSHGVYAQDQWTIQRLTLQGAVRYDHFRSDFPDAQLGPNPFIPVAFVFPASSGARFHDVTPRIAATYDLFGDGRTALKVHLGKYMVGQESSATGAFGWPMNPISRLAVDTNRSWNDANRNFVPDCDLRNRAADGECGAVANRNFGRDVFSVTYDPEVTSGWDVRPYSWDFGVSVQRELVPRVSATVGYFRRWFGNFMVTDNLATTAADFTLFDLPVPVDPRLPTSGGVVRGVATINPDKFGQVNNQVTAAKNFGTQIERWHGVDATINARLPNGVVVQGGLSTGSTLRDACEVAAKLPEILGSTPAVIQNPTTFPALEFCRQEQPFQTNIKFLGAYTIPRVDVQVSTTWQSIPGPDIQALFNAPNAVIAPVIGRPLAGGVANQTVNLISPFSMFGDRLNQVDFRVAKLLRFGRTRALVGLDLFNALNSSVVQNQNNTFGPRWLTPTRFLTARLAKVSAQVDF